MQIPDASSMDSHARHPMRLLPTVKRIGVLLILCLFTLVPVLNAEEPLQVVTDTLPLESSALRLLVDRQTGALRQLVDKRTEMSLLAPPDSSSTLFEIWGGEGAWFTSRADALVSLTQDRLSTTQGVPVQRVSMAYVFSHPSGSLSVAIRIQADPDQPEIHFDIEVENRREGLILEFVRFPILELRRHLDDTGTEQAFIPGGEGSVVRGSGIDGMWGMKHYPGWGSMQFTAYYNARTGVGLECHEAHGEPKYVGVYHNPSHLPDRVRMLCEHRIIHEPNAEIATFPRVVFPVRRSWQVAAEHYKQWALEQWWAQPKERPAQRRTWTYGNLVVIESDLRPQYCGLRTMPLKSYQEILAEWQEALGGGVTLLPLYRGFAHYGTYVSPHYFPLYPDEPTLARLFADVHELGHRNMVMVAGLVWMKERDAFISGPAYWVQPFDGKIQAANGEWIRGWEDTAPPGPEVCVITRDGVPYESYRRNWAGRRSQMCPGHSYAAPEESYPRKVLVELAYRLSALGVDLFQLDQMNGGWSEPCYSTQHGHPCGPGPWVAESIGRLMASVLEAGRSRNADFALSLEDPGELWLPYLDVVGVRPSALNGHPAVHVDRVGVDGYREPLSYTVPAFSYVYGQLVRPQTWDIGINSNHPDHREFNAQKSALSIARTCVSGTSLAFGIAPWMLVNEFAPPPRGWSHEKDPPDAPYASLYPTDAIAQRPDRADASHLELLRNAAQIMGGPAQRFLNHGAMIEPPMLESPTLQFTEWHWDSEARQGVERKWRDRAIHHNAWELADGSVAVLMVNASLTQSYTVPVPTHFAPMASGPATELCGEVSIHRVSEGELTHESRRLEELHELLVRPCEVILIQGKREECHE